MLCCSSLSYAQVTISGTVYSDIGVTNIGTGVTVSVSVNGAAVAGSDDTDASGNYSIPNISVNASDVLLVFIDDETENGVTVTVAGTSALDDLDIYQDYLFVREDNSGTQGNANLALADDSGDSDITAIYTMSGNDLTATNLYSTNNWTTGGDVATAGDLRVVSGIFYANPYFDTTVAGTLHVLDGATFRFTLNPTLGNASLEPDSTVDGISAEDFDFSQFNYTFGNLRFGYFNGGNTTFPDTSVTIAGNLNLSSGGGTDIYLDDDKTLSVGSLDVSQGANLISTGSGTLVLGGDVVVAGNVRFDSSGGGSGDADGISIVSSSPGVQREWRTTGVAAIIQMVDVAVSDMRVGTIPGTIAAASSTDNGNNTNWVFGSGVNYSGRVYTDRGITSIGAGKQISLSLNGEVAIQTVTTDSNGDFLFANVPAGVNEFITVYLDDEPEDGVTISKNEGSADNANLDVYVDHVTLRADHTNVLSYDRFIHLVDDSGDPDITDLISSDIVSFTVAAGYSLYFPSTAGIFHYGRSMTAGSAVTPSDVIVEGAYSQASAHSLTTYYLTAYGDLQVLPGAQITLSARGGLSVGGNLTNDGTIVASSTSELQLIGSSQTIDDSSTSYNNILSTNQAKTVEIVGSLTALGDFTNSENLVLNTGTLRVQNDVTNTAAITGTATLESFGPDDVDYSLTNNFDLDLIVSRDTINDAIRLNTTTTFPTSSVDIQSGAIAVQNAMSVGGTLSVQSGARLSLTHGVSYPTPITFLNSLVQYNSGAAVGNLPSDLANLNGGLTIVSPSPGVITMPDVNAVFGGSLTKSSTGTLIFDDDKSVTVNDRTVLSGLVRATGSGDIFFGNEVVVNDNSSLIINSGGSALGHADQIQLRSTSPGTRRNWRTNGTGRFVLVDVDIQDQEADGTSPATISAISSTDSGNNVNFTFDEAVSGSVFQSDRTTPLTGVTVSASINGGAVAASAVTNGSGAYSLPSLVISPGDLVAVFIDDETENGVAVTVHDAASAPMINIYQNHLNVRHDNSSALTNTNLALADNSGDADISSIYSVVGSDLSVNGGLVTSGNYSPDGSIVLTGGWTDLGGTYTHGGGSVSFLAVSGAFDISEDDSFFDVSVNDSTGSVSYLLGLDLTIANDLLITDSILDTDDTNDYDVVVGRDLLMTGGLISANDSVVSVGRNASLVSTENSSAWSRATLQMQGTGALSLTSVSSFYSLVAGVSGGVVTLNDYTTVADGTLTVGSGEITGAGILGLRDVTSISYDPASSISMSTLNLRGTITLPPLSNGYDTNIQQVVEGTITQSGDLVVINGHNLDMGFSQNSAHSGTWNSVGFAISVDGNIRIGNGNDTGLKTFDISNSNLTVGGDFYIAPVGTGSQQATVVSTGSTVEFDGSVDQTLTLSSSSLHNWTTNKSGGTLTLTDDVGVTGDFIHTAGTLDASTNSITISVNGTAAQSFTFNGVEFWNFEINKPSGTVTFLDDQRFAQDWTHLAGTTSFGTTNTIFTGDGTVTSNGQTFYNLVVNESAPDSLVVSGPISVSNDFSVQVGEASTGSSDMTITGTLSVSDSAELRLTSSNAKDIVAGNVTLSSDSLVVYTSGNAPPFNPGLGYNYGNVTFFSTDGILPDADITVQGHLSAQSSTFYFDDDKNLSVGSMTVNELINFGSGDLIVGGPVVVNSALIFDSGGAGQGDADSIQIRSSSPGVRRTWNTDGSGIITISDVDVQDQEWVGAQFPQINAISSTDSGNNVNWNFATGISFSGTAYSDAGVTPLVGRTVSVESPLSGVIASAVTAGDGSFSFANLAVSADSTLLVFLDDAAEYGASLFKLDDNTASSSISLYAGHVLVTGDQVVNNGDFNSLLTSADPDLLQVLSTGNGLNVNDNFDVIITSSTELRTRALILGSSGSSGDLTVDGTLNINLVNFSLEVYGDAVFNGTTSVNPPAVFGGDFINNTGSALTFTDDVTFAGASHTINDTHTKFDHVLFDSTTKVVDIAGQIAMSNMTVTGDMNFNSGIVTVDVDLSVFGGSNLVGAGQIHLVGGNGQIRVTHPGTIEVDMIVDKLSSSAFMSLSSDLTLPSSSIVVREGFLRLLAYDLIVAGGVTVEDGGTFSLQGNQSFTVPVLQAGSTVRYVNRSSSDLTLPSSISSFENLTLLGTSTGNYIFPDTMITVSEVLEIKDISALYDDDKTLQVDALVIEVGGALNNTGSGDLVLGGDVTIDGSLDFNASGGLSFGGDSDDIQIRSTTGTVQRNWQGTGTISLVDVDVQDQTAIGGSPASISVISGTDSGNNVNWTFDEVLAGRVFQADRTTAFGAGITVSGSLNGGAVVASADTDVNGDFALPGLAISAGDILTLFIDDETENGVTVTEVDGAGVANLNIYQDHLAIRHDNSSSLTNVDLALADNSGDADISAVFTLSGSALTVANDLLVEGSFVPGGNVTTNDLYISAALDSSGHSLVVLGDLTNATGAAIVPPTVIGFNGATQTLNDPHTTYGTVNFDGVSKVVTIAGGEFNASGPVTVHQVTVFNGDSVHLSGDFTVNSNISGTAAIELVGASDSVLRSDASIGSHIVVNKDTVAGMVTKLGSSPDFADVTIREGTLYTINNNLSLSGVLTAEDNGRVLVDNATNAITASNFDFQVGSTVIYQGTVDLTLFSNLNNYYNLELNAASGSGYIYTFPDVDLQVNGTLTISDVDGRFDDDKNVTVLGDIAIGSSGRFINSGTGDLILGGDINNTNGDLIFNSSGGGLVGGDADAIQIRSSVPGIQRDWLGPLSSETFTLVDVDIQDMNNASGTTIFATSSTDSGNNTNFVFDEAVTGAVYQSDRSTPITGVTVSVSINGGAVSASADTDGSGGYVINGLSLSAGDIVTAFIDDETEKGVSVTEVAGVGVSDLDVFQDFLVVDNDNGGATTNTDLILALALGDSDLTDIFTNPSSSTILVSPASIYVEGSWTTGGVVRLAASSSDLFIAGTFSPTNNVEVNGSWIDLGGTFVSGTSQVVFEGTSSSTETLSENEAFYDVEINYTGSKQLQLGSTIVINNELVIADGIMDANGFDISIGGDLLVTSGQLQASTSMLTFNGSDAQSLTSASSTIGAVTVSNTHPVASVTFADTLALGRNLSLLDGQVVFGAGNLTILDSLSTGTALSIAVGSSFSNVGTGNLVLGGDVSNSGVVSFDSSDDAANGIAISSSSLGVQRDWQGTGSFSFVDVTVQDQTVNNGTPVSISAVSSTNAGNNVNWIFDGAVLSATEVALSSDVATSSSDATVSFTTSNPVPANGLIAITFPAGFDVSSVTGATSFDIDGAIAVSSIVGQTVVLSRSGGAVLGASAVVDDLVLSGLVNPATAGTTGAFSLETQENSGASIDTGTAVGVDISSATFILGGVIRDGEGNPLAGVEIDGGGLGTRTSDSSGAFNFGPVPSGTNYSLNFLLSNFSIAPISGVLLSDTSLSVSGTRDGLAVLGQVTLSNLQRTPIAGVKVTDGTVSTQTDANGNYELAGVTSGATVFAELDGFKFEEPSSGADSVLIGSDILSDLSVNFVATPALAERSFSAWNTFLEMTAVLELLNESDAAIVLSVFLRSADGSVLLSLPVNLQPNEKRDLILNDLLQQTDEYGVVEVQSSSPEYSGQVTQYRVGDTGGFEFAYSLPLQSGMSGNTGVPYNSYQPSLNPSEQQFKVTNWLSIINLSSSIQGYGIKRFRSDGVLMRDDFIFIPPFGRADLEGGHLEAQEAGFHLLEPMDPDADYLSFITRYGDIGTEATGVLGYRYATTIFASTPSMRTQYVPVTTLNGSSMWLEITNFDDSLEELSLVVFADDGTQLHQEVFGLPGRTQRHFDVGSVLDGHDNGYVRFTSVTGTKVSVTAVKYFNKSDEVVDAVDASIGSDVFGSDLQSFYNTFLNTGNWLKLTNISTQFQSVTVEVAGVATVVSIPPERTELISLSGGIAPADSYGEVVVIGGDYGSILGEVVKTQGAMSSDEVPGFAISTNLK